MDDPTAPDDRRLTVDEAYRAAFYFVAQYYEREPIEPLFLMLHAMTAWSPEAPRLRETADPATWGDWMSSVARAISSDAPLEIPGSTLSRVSQADMPESMGQRDRVLRGLRAALAAWLLVGGGVVALGAAAQRLTGDALVFGLLTVAFGGAALWIMHASVAARVTGAQRVLLNLTLIVLYALGIHFLA